MRLIATIANSSVPLAVNIIKRGFFSVAVGIAGVQSNDMSIVPHKKLSIWKHP